ncbi:MAG: hypothetical protein JWP95_1389 [Actinotalea sp.]|nr:hypothetical protein [Actinotalea sp.]
MPFDTLEPEQQQAFRTQLARFDVDETALIAEELVVPEGTTVSLSPSSESGGEPRRLVTSDLDTLRRWVGLPEGLDSHPVLTDAARFVRAFPTLAAKVPALSRPRRVSARAAAEVASMSLADLVEVRPEALVASVGRYAAADERERMVNRLSSDELDTIRAAAYAYVHGSKATASPYKRAVEDYFKAFEVWGWFYTEIRVKRNSTLVFGAGANVATAYRVILEPGARIRSYGHLRVDCTQLTKQKAIVLPDHVFANDLTIVRRRIDL